MAKCKALVGSAVKGLICWICAGYVDSYCVLVQETTAHEVVMLALREFGSSESSRSVTLNDQTVSEVEYQL